MTTQQYYDEGDVLIYDGNWVSWLSPSSYNKYREWFAHYNFGGTSDWAIDLNATYTEGGSGEAIDPDLGNNYPACDYTKVFNTLEELSAASGDMRSDCISVYTLQTLVTMLNVA